MSGAGSGASRRENIRSNAEYISDLRPQLSKKVVAPVAFGAILQPLNSSMIAVALVGIRSHFHAAASATWLVSGLYLAAAVAAPAMGRLADLLGPRRVSLGGFALVGVASAVAPFAPSIGVLVACRVLIGVGTAAQYPCGVAMIRRAADETRAAPHNALATLAVCAQVMVALGPALGGLLVGLLGWGGIFWINIPLVASAAVAITVWGPADAGHAQDRRGGQFDLPGMALFVLAVGSLMCWLLSLSQTPQWWWIAAMVPAFGALIAWSARTREPFLNVRLLRNRLLSVTYLRTIGVYTAFYGIFYGLPQWLEESRGLGPTDAGLVVLPIAVFGVFSTVLATRMQRRLGIRAPFLVGTAALLVGGLLLTLPTADTPVPLLLVVCAVLGLPNGFNNMSNQNAVYAAAPADRVGAASGLYRTSQYVGANLAAAVLALLVGTHTDDVGLHQLGLVVALISAVLLVTAVPMRCLRRATPH
ncbi:MFS transporter [Streptomyces sp. NPDC090088]|uniref:MFS transporter n=1 Tax=Streptomyces sp. NPDC090088 TaxID=3365944 RepID=UPI0038301B6C